MKLYMVSEKPNKLRELLRKKLGSGISQTDLGKEIGVSQGTIFKTLNTETEHTVKTLEKYSAYFGYDFLSEQPTLNDTENNLSYLDRARWLRLAERDPRVRWVMEQNLKIFEGDNEKLKSAIVAGLEFLLSQVKPSFPTRTGTWDVDRGRPPGKD
jgi:transcriptional regulator with XRE-family HTH domain